MSNNQRGNSIHQVINNHYLIVPPQMSTYRPFSRNKRPDITEILISKTSNHIHHSIVNILDPRSDHSRVLLKLDSSMALSCK